MKVNKKIGKISAMTLVGIVNDIKGQKIEKFDKEVIDKAKEKIRIHTERNKKLRNQLKKAESALKAKKNKKDLLKQLQITEDIENIKKYILPIDSLKNQLNYLEGKDFYYVVNDNVNESYKIKRSEILKMKDNSFFIDKFKKGVEGLIEKVKKDNRYSAEEKKNKIFILKNKLLESIKSNQIIYQLGQKDINKLSKKEKELIEHLEELDDENDVEGSDGDRLMPVHIVGETINII